MNENIVCSEKIKLTKKLLIAWIVIAALLVVVLVISIISFSGYKKGQDAAVELTLAATSQFDDYQDDYKTMVKEMYDTFNPTSYKVKVNGVWIDNYDVVKSARKADEALGDLLTDAGYSCYYGSKYLAYVGYFDYTVHNNPVIFIIWGALALVLGALHLFCFFDSKKSMIIDADRIVCKRGKKTAKEFMLKDVKSVELAPLKGLKVKGAGIKYQLILLSNADALKTTIMDSLAAIPSENVVATEIKQEILPSSADELKKYKELLESGVITQEEFDAKKKQLLGL